MAKIVILSGIQVIDNPRVVKEADALTEAGHEVEVLAALYDEPSARRTHRLLEKRTWRHTPVADFSSGSLVSRVDSVLLRVRWRLSRTAKSSFGWETPEQLGLVPRRLLHVARQRDADLYISHLPQALWAGIKLAEAGRAVALDMEDWYSEDCLPRDRARQPIGLIKAYERALLQRSAYATTTSRVLAHALAAAYDAPAPEVVRNSFPLEESIDGKRLDRTDAAVPSITWFSQTVGPGRGLEELVAALSRVEAPFQLHIRGAPRDGYLDSLLANAGERLRNRIWFHPQVPQEELLSRLAEHDIGYCGELSDCRSRDLTVTNKILEYLRAGLAVVASDTAGQREVADQVPDAVRIFRQRDEAELRRTLEALLLDPNALRRAKAAARPALQAHFDWTASKRQLQRLAAAATDASRPRPVGAGTDGVSSSAESSVAAAG